MLKFLKAMLRKIKEINRLNEMGTPCRLKKR